MKPIDKIEWRENRKKEEQLLEYVSLLEQIYIPDFDYGFDDPSYNCTTVKLSDLSPEELEEVANRPFEVSDILLTLAKRYNDEAITQYFNYDAYIKNDIIQNFIKDLELDVDKFWFLILFTYDFSWHYCMEGIDTAYYSPYEQLQLFTCAILKKVENYDKYKGSTLNTPVKVKISIENEKHDIVIDDPTALHYIASVCTKQMKEDKMEEWKLMNEKKRLDSSTSISDSLYIYYFARMFLSFFDMQPQIVDKRRKGANYSTKEKDLVCQLIAFTRISTKDCWKRTDNDTLKSFLRQYKNSEIGCSINSIYPSFRM